MLSQSLLERLADGSQYSRAELVSATGLDGAALETALGELEAAGLSLVADAAASDRLTLAKAIDWIDVAAVERALSPAARIAVDGIGYTFQTESTNRSLLDGSAPSAGRMAVQMAEHQLSGRGRRGRSWIMPPGSGLALSVAWRFAAHPAALNALSLAVGAAARRAVRDHCAIEVGLKWPNDLIVDGRKLGGILVELRTDDAGGCLVVAGIGINVSVPRACLDRVGSARVGAIDLASVAGDARLDRSELAGHLISHLAELFCDYAATGFEPYRPEWRAAHVLEGRAIELATPAGTEYGRVEGIDADGALLVGDDSGQCRRVVSGDVTVRIS